MNWKVIFLLSLFGMAMGIATVYVIPSNIEPIFWLVVFIISAYVIAKYCPGRYFLHGLLTSIVNSVWITAIHFGLYDAYVANHASEIAAMEGMGSPRLMMLIFGPIIGVVSGIVLGLFALVAAKLVKRNSPGPMVNG